MPDKSYLIIGVDGLIGGALARELASRNVTVYTTAKPGSERKADVALDLATAAIERMPLPQADVVLLCASFNGFAACRRDPVKARQVNAIAPEILTQRLLKGGTKVIYLSSSAVFDFQIPHIRASAPTCARTVYGMLKAEGERRVLAQGQGATVVRLAKVVSVDAPLFSGWQDALRNGKSIGAFSDLHFCPISLDFATKAIIEIAKSGEDGIYQVSGASDISYAQAGRHIAKSLGIPQSRVVEESAHLNGIPSEEIATFTSMDMSRYTALTNQKAPEPLDVLDSVFGLSVARTEPRHIA